MGCSSSLTKPTNHVTMADAINILCCVFFSNASLAGLEFTSYKKVLKVSKATKMEFPDVNTKEGLQFLDSLFLSQSYVSDYEPTQNDAVLFRAIPKEPNEQSYPNANRWYKHLKNLGNARKDLPQPTKLISIKSEKAVSDEVDFTSKSTCTYL